MKIVDITPISIEISSEESEAICGGLGFLSSAAKLPLGTPISTLGYHANEGGGPNNSPGTVQPAVNSGGVRGLTNTWMYRGFLQGIITGY